MENKIVVVKGTLIKARRESKEFRGHKTTEKFCITLANVEALPTEFEEAFKESGEKFTPSFIKNFEGFINLSTKYDIPVLAFDGGKYTSLEDEITNGFPFMKAEVGVAVACKDGALYPKSIRFYSEGEDYDPFAMFD